MADVTPGPCGPTGCPPPTQIDCVVVDKVYDSCSQTVNTTQAFAATGCTVSGCSVDLASSTCTIGAINPSAAGDDYSDITFVIGINYTVTCTTGGPLTKTAYTTQVVTLYNPSGTTPSCNILSATCNCVNLPDSEISCALTVCLLFQTTAVVQIMVPSYGFCAPPTCPTVGPVLPCPPSSLYPPQAGGLARNG